MASSRNRTSYLAEISLRQFLASCGSRAYHHVYTFKEEITDKKEAQRRFKPIADYLTREGIKYLVFWETQPEREKRTGKKVWHVHLVCNRWVPVQVMRAFAVSRGWGTHLQMEQIGAGAYRWQDPEQFIRYLCKYLSKAYTFGVDSRVRLFGGKRELMKGTTNFRWLNGLSRAWRMGMTEWLRRWPEDSLAMSKGKYRRAVMNLGCEITGLLDFAPVVVGGLNPYIFGDTSPPLPRPVLRRLPVVGSSIELRAVR